ncbi:Histone-Lysine N-Methyltransferase Ash1L [Manis pentadactyla]|nr:Histone-Lysine N-Methyltransferase Ash1L [Manis pentadactyla]
MARGLLGGGRLGLCRWIGLDRAGGSVAAAHGYASPSNRVPSAWSPGPEGAGHTVREGAKPLSAASGQPDSTADSRRISEIEEFRAASVRKAFNSEILVAPTPGRFSGHSFLL